MNYEKPELTELGKLTIETLTGSGPASKSKSKSTKADSKGLPLP